MKEILHQDQLHPNFEFRHGQNHYNPNSGRPIDAPKKALNTDQSPQIHPGPFHPPNPPAAPPLTPQETPSNLPHPGPFQRPRIPTGDATLHTPAIHLPYPANPQGERAQPEQKTPPQTPILHQINPPIGPSTSPSSQQLPNAPQNAGDRRGQPSQSSYPLQPGSSLPVPQGLLNPAHAVDYAQLQNNLQQIGVDANKKALDDQKQAYINSLYLHERPTYFDYGIAHPNAGSGGVGSNPSIPKGLAQGLGVAAGAGAGASLGPVGATLSGL